MIRCIGIENPWTKRVCMIGRDIIGLGNRSNRGRLGGVSEAKKLLIFTRHKSHSLRWRRRLILSWRWRRFRRLGYMSSARWTTMLLITPVLNVTWSIIVGTMKPLVSVSVATINTPGITARVRWSKHYRSVIGNLRGPRPSHSG